MKIPKRYSRIASGHLSSRRKWRRSTTRSFADLWVFSALNNQHLIDGILSGNVNPAHAQKDVRLALKCAKNAKKFHKDNVQSAWLMTQIGFLSAINFRYPKFIRQLYAGAKLRRVFDFAMGHHEEKYMELISRIFEYLMDDFSYIHKDLTEATSESLRYLDLVHSWDYWQNAFQSFKSASIEASSLEESKRRLDLLSNSRGSGLTLLKGAIEQFYDSLNSGALIEIREAYNDKRGRRTWKKHLKEWQNEFSYLPEATFSKTKDAVDSSKGYNVLNEYLGKGTPYILYLRDQSTESGYLNENRPQTIYVDGLILKGYVAPDYRMSMRSKYSAKKELFDVLNKYNFISIANVWEIKDGKVQAQINPVVTNLSEWRNNSFCLIKHAGLIILDVPCHFEVLDCGGLAEEMMIIDQFDLWENTALISTKGDKQETERDDGHNIVDALTQGRYSRESVNFGRNVTANPRRMFMKERVEIFENTIDFEKIRQFEELADISVDNDDMKKLEAWIDRKMKALNRAD
jgi:hypothetical protein